MLLTGIVAGCRPAAAPRSSDGPQRRRISRPAGPTPARQTRLAFAIPGGLMYRRSMFIDLTISAQSVGTQIRNQLLGTRVIVCEDLGGPYAGMLLDRIEFNTS